MPPTVTTRPLWYMRTLVFALALAPAGCGLAEYEKKMGEAEARVKRFDDESRLLGDPLTLPPPADKNAPPPDVFLRPPKGVAKDPQAGEGPYAHYAATSGVCADLFLLFGNPSDNRDKLEKQIQDWLAAPGQNVGWQPSEVHPPGRPVLAFDKAEWADPRAPANAPAVFLAYVRQSPGLPAVGLAFRVTQANRTAADSALRMSLETYREAGDAAQARAAYGKGKPR